MATNSDIYNGTNGPIQNGINCPTHNADNGSDGSVKHKLRTKHGSSSKHRVNPPSLEVVLNGHVTVSSVCNRDPPSSPPSVEHRKEEPHPGDRTSRGITGTRTSRENTSTQENGFKQDSTEGATQRAEEQQEQSGKSYLSINRRSCVIIWI